MLHHKYLYVLKSFEQKYNLNVYPHYNFYPYFFSKQGFCLPNQIACGNGEKDCYAASGKCNGVWDCQEKGGDELHCGKMMNYLYIVCLLISRF